MKFSSDTDFYPCPHCHNGVKPCQIPSPSAPQPLGPQAPASPLTSESVLSAESISFAPPEAILSAALTALRRLGVSFDLSLNVASGQWNFSLQGVIPTSAAGATEPLSPDELRVWSEMQDRS